MISEVIKTDFLVIGGGLAGLNAALEASKYGQVMLVTKTTMEDSSSYLAQGGVAAVMDKADSFENHIKDTQEAGREYCNTEAVEKLVKEGAARINELISLGMPFDKQGNQLNLGMEGGHSRRRILHANGAATGKAIVEFLISKISQNRNIKLVENVFVYDLISNENRCHGAVGYLYKQKKSIQILSNAVILATGGYSGLFSRTTNPHTSTGDGLWLAWNHGAVLKDLEFVQFHPTAFYDKNGEVFLLSEALRGEGARLYNAAGERFMMSHPAAELSPRDVVAKEIWKQIAGQKENFVYLDLTHLDPQKVKNRFPGLIRKIESFGIDISKQGIPVAPAAHYCIGGIETDLDGQTGVQGLYACGEVAATGVHGANRLASNSLLECLVFSKRAVEHASAHCNKKRIVAIPLMEFTLSEELEEPFLVQKKVVTSLLNQYAGIERSAAGLNSALAIVEEELKSPLYHFGNEYYLKQMREMVNISELILRGALSRQESRGVHFRTDFPYKKDSEKAAIRFSKKLFTRKQAAS